MFKFPTPPKSSYNFVTFSIYTL